jgi:hypothetical protein
MRNVIAAALVAAVAASGSPALGIAAESKNAARAQAPQSTQVTISVTNSAGQALQGAHVNVYQTVDGKEQLVYSGVTNAQGLLTGNLPAGAFRIEVLSGAQVVGTGTLTVVPGVPAAVTLTTTVAGTTAGGTGGALGALGLGGLGPLATAAVIAAAGTLVYVGVQAAKDDASASR